MSVPVLSKFKKALAIGAAILAVGAGAFGVGYIKGVDHASTKAITAAVQAPTEAVQTILKQDAKDQTEQAQRVVRDVAREEALQAQVDTLKTTNLNLQSILNEKANPHPDCTLPIGNVRLLNAGKTFGPVGDQEGISDTTGGSDYYDKTPSIVSCEDLIADDLDVSSRYNALRAEKDKLNEWVQKELIEPMQAKAASSK